MDTEFIKTLITIMFGALLGGIVNHLFTRRRNEAEIEKLKAETEKLRSEIKLSGIEGNLYNSTKANEIVVYDGRRGIRFDDITGYGNYYGQQGVIVIQGESVGLVIRTYLHDGKESMFIPKNELVSGYRYFHASCDVKVISASYEFRIFMWDDLEEGDSVDDRVISVTDTVWTKTDFNFRALPNKHYRVHILAERLSGDGSLQIRDLVVVERVRE